MSLPSHLRGAGERVMKSGASNIPCCKEVSTVVRVQTRLGDPWVSVHGRIVTTWVNVRSETGDPLVNMCVGWCDHMGKCVLENPLGCILKMHILRSFEIQGVSGLGGAHRKFQISRDLGGRIGNSRSAWATW